MNLLRVNPMKKCNIFVALLMIVFSNNAYTEEATFLTVDEIIADGYQLLSGLQILDIMNNHTIKVVDIETGAVSISKNDNLNDAIDRKFTDKKADKLSSMLDPRLMARAPPLDGKIERRVVGDELVSTNGVRTYHFRLYKKQEKIYAVRDIDHGDVFFEVMVK